MSGAPRVHLDTCVVFCTNSDEDVPHACWCQDGRLSYHTFKLLHPEWALLDSYDWLGTHPGRTWLRAMDPAR